MCEEATNSRADCDCEQEVCVSGRACGDACWVPSVRMGTAHSKGPFLKLSSGPSFMPALEAATCHGHCHTCSPGLGARKSAMLHLPTGLYHLLSGPLP